MIYKTGSLVRIYWFDADDVIFDKTVGIILNMFTGIRSRYAYNVYNIDDKEIYIFEEPDLELLS